MTTTMRATSRPRIPRGATIACIAMLLAALVVASIAIGSRSIDPSVVLDAIVDRDATDDRHGTVWLLRIPRTIVVLLVGAALGTAGTLMQAMTRNPLAEPGLLGVNAGAAAAVVTGAVATGSVLTMPTFAFAFVGAALSSVAVYALGGTFGRSSNPVRLVLAGAALAAVLGAYSSGVLVNFPRIFDRFRFWDAGSFQGTSWDVVTPLAVSTLVGTVIALVLARSLDTLALGTEMSSALGVSPKTTWITAGVAVVLLAGGATAAAGPVAFIGLVAPLIARSIVGPGYVRILPLSMLIAGLVLLVADIAGRVLMFPSELEASIVCALIGAPSFVAIVRRRKVPRL